MARKRKTPPRGKNGRFLSKRARAARKAARSRKRRKTRRPRRAAARRPKVKRPRRKPARRPARRKTTRRPARRRAAARRPARRRAAPRRRNPAPMSLAVLNPSKWKKAKYLATAGGSLAGALLLGPCGRSLAAKHVPYADKVPGVMLESGIPMGVGYALRRWGKFPVAGGYMFLGGIVLAMLAAFRWIKPRIPYVKDMNLGPLGNISPIYMDNAQGVYAQGADGNLYAIEGLTDTGPLVELVLDDGKRQRGAFLGELVLPSGSAFLLRTPGARNIVPIAPTPNHARQLVAQGAQLGAVWKSEAQGVGAVWKDEAQGVGAVWKDEAQGLGAPYWAPQDRGLGAVWEREVDGDAVYTGQTVDGIAPF